MFISIKYFYLPGSIVLAGCVFVKQCLSELHEIGENILHVLIKYILLYHDAYQMSVVTLTGILIAFGAFISISRAGFCYITVSFRNGNLGIREKTLSRTGPKAPITALSA